MHPESDQNPDFDQQDQAQLPSDMAFGDDGAVPADQAGDQQSADGVMSLLIDVEKQLGQLRKAHAERSATEQQVKEQAADLDRRESDLNDQLAAVATRQQEIDAQAESLHGRQAELEARANEVQSLASELAEQSARIEQDRASLDAGRAEIEEKARELTRLSEEMNAAQETLDQAGVDAEIRIADAQREVERLEAERGELAARVEGFEARETELAGEAGVNAQRAEQAEHDAVQLREQVARAEQAAFEAESAMESLREQLDTAQAEGNDNSAATHELTGQIETLQSQLAEAQAAAQEYAAQVEALSQAPAAGDDIRVEQLEEHVAALQESLEQESLARQDTEHQLTEALASAAAAQRLEHMPADAAFNRLRHQRLRNVRHALTIRADKVRRAGEALQKRFKQCDDLISQRAELVAVRDSLQAAQSRLSRSVSVGRTLRHVGFVLLLIVAMAGVSWGVASHFTPGLYAVDAEIAAKTNGREATPDELAEWSSFHEEMVSDPRFIEFAAERFRRHGITEMADPAGLTSRLETDFTALTPAAGTLALELRGRGSSRTAHELDVLLTALVSRSNSMRIQRADPTTTVTSSLPVATSEPIDFTHLTTAAFIFGGSVIFSLLLGFAIWKRLSHEKQKFEQQDQVDSVIDESRWVHPRRAA
ncbi:MAG: hypothetical protein AAGB51_15170 [Planctomycetota bacterium]